MRVFPFTIMQPGGEAARIAVDELIEAGRQILRADCRGDGRREVDRATPGGGTVRLVVTCAACQGRGCRHS